MGNKLKIREEAKKLNPIDDLLFRKMAEDRAYRGVPLPLTHAASLAAGSK